MNRTKTYPVVLSIAGSDSSGGAGIQADIKTCVALGVYGATAITAITAQNTMGVHSQLAITPQMVYDQIVAVLDDLHPVVVKIGMLSNRGIVEAVAEALSKYSLSIILDPVIVSSTGHRLLSIEAQEVIKQRLMPLSMLLTPNIPEMATLANCPLDTYEQRVQAANTLFGYGVQAILLKGGHDEGDTKSDILFTKPQSEIETTIFTAETISTHNTHGTGCTLSSAIAANLAKGYGLEAAVQRAKEYISGALAAMLDLGKGAGPMNHAFDWSGRFAK
jgi:hydroxymethylpyrimidine/phosphomethylpyrimidine kinase